MNSALSRYDQNELKSLMKISEKIAGETRQSILQFGTEEALCGAALFSYSGTVFQHLDALSLTGDQLEFAGNTLIILSGLFGVLKPMDKVHPYRLEMKTALKNSRGENLYKFWKDDITDVLVQRDEPILNLASNEYAKAVDFKKINREVYNLQFKERKGDKLQTVGMYSKMARGVLAGRIIREKIIDPETILSWDVNGYRFDAERSSDFNWVFAGNWRV